MKVSIPICFLSWAAALTMASPEAWANSSVHLAYHWHMHQPIYWPDINPLPPGTNRYQFAGESISLKLSGGNMYSGSTYKHPRNQLVNGDGGEFDSVFDKSDRINAYQFGGRNSISTITNYPDAGASVSYSGALMENVWSLGKDNRYGYGPTWNQGYAQARGSTATWRTSGGKPRADLVGMTYHHAFSPLLPKSVLRKEIQIFKEIWWKSWNGHPNQTDHSKGFWPIEAAFSRHMIPILVSEGYQWVIVANSHLARTCTNYLEVAQRGNSGWNIDPPNRADVLGPNVPAHQWWSGTLDGRGGAFPAPFAYQAHQAKYVDPNTGQETKITLVPMCDLLSYKNGFASMNTAEIDAEIAPFNNPAQPSLVLMAHDGDNAWGGGHSYYHESVPGLMNEAAGKGYRPTTIEQFLADHPPPDNDVVHVEDGAWVNAANDWGHPQFINWLWPPTRSPNDPQYEPNDPRTWFDLENGWTEDWRNWAVIVAGANYCETAEQITLSAGGTVQAWKIQEPTQKNGVNNNPNAAEQAWHFFLGGLDSGFLYYGTSLDDEIKQTIACNRALALAAPIIGDGAQDQTPPTVFKPQRFPWNPGGMGWGPLTGYREVGFNGKPPYSSDFYVWTHVFDVSGTTNVTLYVRVDNDGVNPLADNQNETYAGGPSAGNWSVIPMNRRAIPKGNVTGNSQINFFVEPTQIADFYWAKVIGYRNQLLDYYVAATDSRGHVQRTDIQHVWVADDHASSQPPPAPQNLTATTVGSNRLDLAWTSADGASGYLVRRSGTQIATTSAASYSDVGLSPNTQYCYTVLATNSAGSSLPSNQACAFTLGSGTNGPPFILNGTVDFTNYFQGAVMGLTIYAAVRGGTLYVATHSPGNSGPHDHFILVTDTLLSSASSAAPWAKSGLTAMPSGKPFLGAESLNTFIGWFNAPFSAASARAPSSSGHMEGTLDLVAAFGSLPSVIYLAVAAYSTADGGALVAQAPAGSGPNLEPPEFLPLAELALRDLNGDGLYDRLDPSLDFKVERFQFEPGAFSFDYATVPGRTYQVYYRDSFNAPWSVAPGSLRTAGSLQTTLTFADTVPASSQRFFRLELLPQP